MNIDALQFKDNPLFPETTLFIGNGFDLSLGLKTKYTDFFNHTKDGEKDFWPTKDVVEESDQLYRRLNPTGPCFGQRDDWTPNTWFDLEDELKQHALRHSPKGIEHINNYEDSFEADKQYFSLLKESLKNYLKFEEKRWRENDSRTADKSTVLEMMFQLCEKAKAYPNIITFNYTNVRRLLANCKYKIQLNEDNIHYVHGSLDQEHIILGINEEKGVPKEYDFLFKSWDDYYGSHQVIDTLKASEIIIFYGLSFGSIDSVYFEDFFRSIIRGTYDEKKKHIVICTYNEDSMREIYRQFFIMGISIMEVKAHCDFHVMLSNPSDRNNPNKFSGDRLSFLLNEWNDIKIDV